jgi:hypothetical protein
MIWLACWMGRAETRVDTLGGRLGQQRAPAAAVGRGLLGGSALGAAALTGARRPEAGMVAGVVPLIIARVSVGGRTLAV